jgi:hypothetical protein
MDDFTSQIYADGGAWAETEVLGNHAIVKVRASDITLLAIKNGEGFTMLPKNVLTATLSDLTANQKTAIRNKIESLGYSTQEIRDKLGNDIGSKTLADVLRFIATRKRMPRVDQNTQTIICDGAEKQTTPIEVIDGVVK